MDPEFEKKVFKAAVINTDELVKSQARDVGDARMTESKEDRSRNLLERTAKRIWKHNLAQEWYRQREISRAKKEILETGNLYVGEKQFDPDQTGNTPASKEASDEAMQAIVERFTSEYSDEMLKEEEQDSKEVLNDGPLNAAIKELIKHFAGTKMSKENFEEEKNLILSQYDKSYASKKSKHIDNLFTIAQEVRDCVDNGEKIAELKFDVEITLGRARETLDTEAHLNAFDRRVEKLQNSKIGKYIANEPVVLGIVAGLWDLGRGGISKAVKSKAAQWMTFGGATIAAAGISAMKERARFTRERAQHQREVAKGMQFKESDMKRRQEMEEFGYDTKKATIIIQNLQADLEKVEQGDITEDERYDIMGRLADLEARIKLNNQQKIDLITYDKFNTIEKDRNTMNEARAKLKVVLRDKVNDFDTQLEGFVDTQKEQLLEGDQGIESTDTRFARRRNSRAWKAALKTTIIGGTLGIAFQEVEAFGSGVFHGDISEKMREVFTGHHTTMSNDALHEETFGNNASIHLPEGVNFTETPHEDGTYDLIRGGHVIATHVPVNFDDHGNLAADTQEALAREGITSDFASVAGEQTSQAIHQSASDYVRDHAEGLHTVHRELFYDNNTPHPFDKNELKTDWGGEHASGIDAKGNYVFNVSRMTAGGSFHGAEHIDATKGGLKMLFSLSKDTQHHVFEVPIDTEGNAVVDPNSELGKLMFQNHDGHAVFTGKFAEVAQSTGIAPDGGENVRILSTEIGHGKDFIDSTVNTDTTVPNVTLHIPNENLYDVPPVIPITGRRPLERGQYRKDTDVQASRPKAEEDTTSGQPQTSSTTEATFDPQIAEGMQYDPTIQESFGNAREEVIVKETDKLYGFADLNRAEMEAQLKDAGKFTQPEILFFETDASKRKGNLKLLEDMKKWMKRKNPKATFRYIALPKNVPKLNTKDMQIYSDKRFKNILKQSPDITEKAKRTAIFHAYKPLGPITRIELEQFAGNNRVSSERLRDIEQKMKNGERLTTNEDMMYKMLTDTLKNNRK